jgi:hypothetical protein
MLPFLDGLVEVQDLLRPGHEASRKGGPYDVAIIFTDPGQSPYPDAYGCYLAGVPIRVGLSGEFAGGVLSHWFRPVPGAHPVDRHLALVSSIGFPSTERRLELNVQPRLQAFVDQKIAKLGLGEEQSLLQVSCRDLSGLAIAEALLKGRRPKAEADGPSCLLVGLDTGVAVKFPARERGTVECALAARSSLTITDSPATAYVAEAVDCPVLFIERNDGSERGKTPAPQYATVNGAGMVCGEESPMAIVSHALRVIEGSRLNSALKT